MRNLQAGFGDADGYRATSATTRQASTATPPDLSTVEAGSPVFCASGTDIGRVAAVLPDAFILERGSFQERQTYRIPAQTVARITGIRVVLNVGCQELERFRTN